MLTGQSFVTTPTLKNAAFYKFLEQALGRSRQIQQFRKGALRCPTRDHEPGRQWRAKNLGWRGRCERQLWLSRRNLCQIARDGVRAIRRNREQPQPAPPAPLMPRAGPAEAAAGRPSRIKDRPQVLSLRPLAGIGRDPTLWRWSENEGSAGGEEYGSSRAKLLSYVFSQRWAGGRRGANASRESGQALEKAQNGNG